MAGGVEADIVRIGTEIAAALPAAARHPGRLVDERAMALATRDAELRAALFRFVDVVPACRSLDDLAEHLTGFLEDVDRPPLPVGVATRLSTTRAGRAALGAAAAAGVRHMAHRFIAGATIDRAWPALRRSWADGIATSVDLLGEATVNAAEADRYADRCAEALAELADRFASVPPQPRLERDRLGPVPRTNLSVKVSALTPRLRPQAPDAARRDAAPRLRRLLRDARDRGAHLHVDMESFDACEAIVELVLDLLAEDEFRDGPSAGLVVQAYLRDSPALCDRILAWATAARRTSPLVVRLVKGAYWDQEVAEARQHGWRPPVFEIKADCDRNFELLTRRLIEARATVRAAIASHNLRSLAHAVAVNRRLGGADGDLELQVLRGLGDGLGEALVRRGHRVRAYCPVGDLVTGMAYLVRRLLENTSNEGFLHAQAGGRPLEELLAAP